MLWKGRPTIYDWIRVIWILKLFLIYLIGWTLVFRRQKNKIKAMGRDTSMWGDVLSWFIFQVWISDDLTQPEEWWLCLIVLNYTVILLILFVYQIYFYYFIYNAEHRNNWRVRDSRKSELTLPWNNFIFLDLNESYEGANKYRSGIVWA